MYLNHKTYYTLNQALKEEFGEKIIKLSIDGGFTCPNRDGTIAKRGCLFCSEKGSGDFTSCADSITEQMEQQISLLSNKWNNKSLFFPTNGTMQSTLHTFKVSQTLMQM